MAPRHIFLLTAALCLHFAQSSKLPFPPSLVGAEFKDYSLCTVNSELTLPMLRVNSTTIDFSDLEVKNFGNLECSGVTVLAFNQRPREPVIHYFSKTSFNMQTFPNATCRDGEKSVYRVFGETRSAFSAAFKNLYASSLIAMNSTCGGFPSGNQDVAFLLGYMRGIAFDFRIPID